MSAAQRTMITCPWCGTSYTDFQSTCDKCGGSLPLPAEDASAPTAMRPATPPPPPREVPRQTTWRILLTDGWIITALVFLLLGAIFFPLGVALTIAVVTAFVGVPFAVIGLLFLVAALPILVWRYKVASQTVEVLQDGEAVLGEVVTVLQNYQVRINGRHPWTVLYRYDVGGQEFRGKVTTLSKPDLSQQAGQPVYVLHEPHDPGQSTIYPNPYGYFGL